MTESYPKKRASRRVFYKLSCSSTSRLQPVVVNSYGLAAAWMEAMR